MTSDRDYLVRMLVALGAPRDLLAWAEALSPAPLLRQLPDLVTRGDWLAWLLERSGAVRHEQLVLALAGVVRASLVHVPRGEDRPRLAVEAVEAFAVGQGPRGALRAAGRASAQVSVSVCAPEWAARHLCLYAVEGPYSPAALTDAAGVVRLAVDAICAARRPRVDRLPAEAAYAARPAALARAATQLWPEAWRPTVGVALVKEAQRELALIRERARPLLAMCGS